MEFCVETIAGIGSRWDALAAVAGAPLAVMIAMYAWAVNSAGGVPKILDRIAMWERPEQEAATSEYLRALLDMIADETCARDSCATIIAIHDKLKESRLRTRYRSEAVRDADRVFFYTFGFAAASLVFRVFDASWYAGGFAFLTLVSLTAFWVRALVVIRAARTYGWKSDA